METKLFNVQGEEIGRLELPKELFEIEINKPLLWEDVTILLGNQHQGLAKTKNRAEVKGGGKKPWRQKGIGWARHGSIRSPIWRKGGVVFGPKPRDYYRKIPKKKKLSALLSSLSAKAKEGKVLVIEDLNLATPKTKIFAKILEKINLIDKNILIGTEETDKNLKLAVRNIPTVNLKRVGDVNCYDVLSADYFLLTKNGLARLEQRCITKRS